MMNLIATILLQAAPAAPAAPANAPAAGGQGAFWIMIIAMFAIMWLFMIRPQRKQQKELEKFRNELKKGDKVVTAGGIYGTVAEIQERSVLIKVDGEVKLRVDKNSIVRDYSTDAQASNDQAQQK
jgi:preprotein translocase subunit YajC